MAWKLFLDDEREVKWIYPDATDDEFVLARGYWDAVKLFHDRGAPSFIAFDHDLGYDHVNHKLAHNGLDVAKIFIKGDFQKLWEIPDDFSFDVHSSNPDGARNIRSLMDSYLKTRGAESTATYMDVLHLLRQYPED